jgi:hypothetical protein
MKGAGSERPFPWDSLVAVDSGQAGGDPDLLAFLEATAAARIIGEALTDARTHLSSAFGTGLA